MTHRCCMCGSDNCCCPDEPKTNELTAIGKVCKTGLKKAGKRKAKKISQDIETEIGRIRSARDKILSESPTHIATVIGACVVCGGNMTCCSCRNAENREKLKQLMTDPELRRKVREEKNINLQRK